MLKVFIHASICTEMAVSEVDKIGELESMGFPMACATKALHYSGLQFIHANIKKLLKEEDGRCPRWIAIVFPTKIELNDNLFLVASIVLVSNFLARWRKAIVRASRKKPIGVHWCPFSGLTQFPSSFE
ncbi:uncharacterized protein LOC131218891 [Magnolia sinica]|uniref:uncharacterized protein LOC131218891 n=1 Tax=Magnolia sinica TaxID=86752 RepID=UPI002657C2D5|nr:uncharacterized protein LOC131218891 [Magnolia sinica]